MLVHSELWADNGDLLSKIYTGTGALKSDVTRSGKMSFAGMLGDATKSLNRFVINNFQDKDRQEVIDLLLVRPGSWEERSPPCLVRYVTAIDVKKSTFWVTVLLLSLL